MGELGTQELTDWSRVVIDGIARQRCHATCAIRCGGWGAYLGRVAGGGLGVLPGWCGLEGHCDRARGSGHHGGTKLGVAFTQHFARLRP